MPAGTEPDNMGPGGLRRKVTSSRGRKARVRSLAVLAADEWERQRCRFNVGWQVFDFVPDSKSCCRVFYCSGQDAGAEPLSAENTMRVAARGRRAPKHETCAERGHTGKESIFDGVAGRKIKNGGNSYEQTRDPLQNLPDRKRAAQGMVQRACRYAHRSPSPPQSGNARARDACGRSWSRCSAPSLPNRN